MVAKFKKQNGSVLVFAVLLMFFAAATAITLSIVLFDEIRAAQNVDQSLKAYYAAESGIEQSLDYIILERQDKSAILEDTLTVVRGYSATFTDQASYEIDSTETVSQATELKFDLNIQASQQLDLFNPDDQSVDLGIDSIALDWKQDCPADGDNSRVEVTLIQWVPGAWFDPDSNPPIYKNIYTCGSEVPVEDYDCRAIEVSPSPGYNYRLRVKSLDCNLPQVQAQLYDNADSRINLFGQAVVKSIGSYGRSRQALEARLPWSLPLTGLADYVIFSQEDLVK